MNVLYHDLCSSQAREPSVPWYAYVPDKTLPVWMSCVIICVLLKHENLLFCDTLMFQTTLYQYECLIWWLVFFSSTRTFCSVIRSCSRQDSSSMNVLCHDLCSSQAREPSVPWYAHVPDKTLPVWMCYIMTCVLLKHENLRFRDTLMFQTRFYQYECLVSLLVFFSSTRTFCSVIRSCSRQDSTSMNVLCHDLCSSQAGELFVPWFAHVPDKTLPVGMSCVMWLVFFSSTRTFCFMIHSCFRQDSTSMNVLYHDLCSSQAREPSVPWYAHVPDKTLPVWMSCVITCVLLKHENLLFHDTLMFHTRLYQYECLVSLLVFFSSRRTFYSMILSCSRQDSTSMNVLCHYLCSSQAREPVPWYAHVPDKTLPVWMPCVMTYVLLKHENLLFHDTLMFHTRLPVWMSCVMTYVLLKHENLLFRDTLMFQTILHQYECLVSWLMFFSSTRTFCSVIRSCSRQDSTSMNVLCHDFCTHISSKCSTCLFSSCCFTEHEAAVKFDGWYSEQSVYYVSQCSCVVVDCVVWSLQLENVSRVSLQFSWDVIMDTVITGLMNAESARPATAGPLVMPRDHATNIRPSSALSSSNV